MTPEPLEREEAESILADAADLVRGVLQRKVAPNWLWGRNEADLRQVLEELDLAASSMVYDLPCGGEDGFDV